ncbi:Amiloride-sensitive sodium channel [Nesidiocoris tenuis]|uniref:Amiloride-sensitive sodium channel n=1 Tax=Nesidiocoris tenuis TaxID=355587 RepID=A0ABN7AVM9_9HEMI|nr:Amiloride-sensitive sodium channel [Nesidiocoris tenuis]
MRKMVKMFATVSNFFENTSLHGFKFIGNREIHWSERILWTIVCIVSWIGSGVLLYISYTAYQENAVRYGFETYLTENTPLPSVSVCEDNNLEPLYRKANELFGKEHDVNLDEVLRELTYFRGSAYYIKEFCNDRGIECPKRNFSELVRKVRSSCEEIFVNCFWSSFPFECCQHFVPIETELGTCFTLNKRNEMKLKAEGDMNWINTYANIYEEFPELTVAVNGSVVVYIHPEYDAPFLNTHAYNILRPDTDRHISAYISVIDIENPPEVRDLSIYQRKCRFPDENNLRSAGAYSYSACIVDCRRTAQMNLCNCTSHLTPNTRPEEHCNYDGIKCLDIHNSRLSVIKSKWTGNDGLECDCLPGCADIETEIVFSHFTNPKYLVVEPGSSLISVKLLKFPYERYKRNVVNGMIELFVSIGVTAGLFLGASLLSIVEVIYYFFFRACAKERKESIDENESVTQNILPFVL